MFRPLMNPEITEEQYLFLHELLELCDLLCISRVLCDVIFIKKGLQEKKGKKKTTFYLREDIYNDLVSKDKKKKFRNLRKANSRSSVLLLLALWDSGKATGRF